MCQSSYTHWAVSAKLTHWMFVGSSPKSLFTFVIYSALRRVDHKSRFQKGIGLRHPNTNGKLNMGMGNGKLYFVQ
uniref:Uncharacterized protein n=1 Tax=Anguilla anguilla TaxID=7936 RepID=A0A0E9X6Y3_ANGAN